MENSWPYLSGDNAFRLKYCSDLSPCSRFSDRARNLCPFTVAFGHLAQRVGGIDQLLNCADMFLMSQELCVSVGREVKLDGRRTH